MRGKCFSILILALSTSGTMSANAAGVSVLAPHRAVYDLELKDASDRSGIKGLTGRMVYDFNGSACDGFTTTFRYVTKINNGEADRVADQQTTTFESGDGKEFRFLTKNFVDQTLDKETRGSAVEKGDGVKVEVTKPAEASYTLDQSFFPTTHLVDMLTRAEKGERLYEANIFDGTEDADRTLTTTVIIGEKNKAAEDGADKAIGATIPGNDYYPVSISYFDPKSEEGQEEPIYQIGFKLYQNGITRDLVMDYGDFSMTGKLVDLKVYDMPDCKP
jgi:hypothetical protein